MAKDDRIPDGNQLRWPTLLSNKQLDMRLTACHQSLGPQGSPGVPSRPQIASVWHQHLSGFCF